MNRKGDLFMLGINILFLLAVILVFWKLSVEFRQPNQHESLGTRQTALLQTYGTAEKMLLYLDTAATFAAYEAADTVMRRGGINLVSSPCGKYAGYELWISPQKKCVPGRDALYEEFARETIKILRGMMNYPGMPPLAEYETDIVADKKIVISARTNDHIVLPIVTAKGNAQSLAADAIRDEEASRLRSGKFTPDSSLVDEVVVTHNKRARAGDIRQIVILDAMQESADALYSYREGENSVHYLVLQDGTLVQLIPEERAALFCEDCPATERVGIALERAAPYPEKQMSTLAAITADILKRREMQTSSVKLLKEIVGEENPKDFDKASFLKQVEVAKSRLEIQVPEGRERSPGGLPVSWVADDHTITSCWGERKIGDGFHDGVDIDDTTSDSVYAFSGGVVVDTCETQGGGRLTGCSSYCGGFGTTVLIEHPDGSKTRYSHMRSTTVKPGDPVDAGQRIGRIGNTGCSTGSHLDFKVFAPGQDGNNEGKNPFCYYADDVLRKMNLVGESCSKYDIGGGLMSRENPLLKKECKGITPLQTQSSYFGGLQVTRFEGSDGTLAKTLENLEKDNLIPLIEEVGNKEGVDPNLLIAFIAQESRGRKNIVSASGCAGLAQFCLGTARGYTSIFGNDFKQCSCSGNECSALQAGCAGDPRFDPERSIRALPLLLKDKMMNFEGMTDKMRFAIAAYNGGEGTILRAIEKTGKPDPSWEEVSAALDRSVIDQSLCPVHSSFCTVNGQDQKITEIRNYVPGVMSFYARLGGSLPTEFSDVFYPDLQLTVKELGRYEFTPNFQIEVPNVLSPAEKLLSWVDSVHETCRGSGDNRRCLWSEAAQFNERQDEVEVLRCSNVEEENIVTTRYRQFLQDCRDNRQSDCFCAFNVNRDDAQLQLYGNAVRTIIDGRPVNELPPNDAGALFAERAGEEPEEVILSLDVIDGKEQYRVWKAEEGDNGDVESFGEYVRGVDTEQFMLYKGEETYWIADSGGEGLFNDEVLACGIYKTQHHVCARIKEKTFKLSEGISVEPTVRFAIHLEDTSNPEQVSDVEARGEFSWDDAADLVMQGSGDIIRGLAGEPVNVQFDPSGSEDISYYLVECKGPGQDGPVRILGREYDSIGRDIPIDDTIETQVHCTNIIEGTSIEITPVDISGNEGETVSADIQDASDAIAGVPS